MSVQFGRWNFDGRPPLPGYIEKVSATLAPYGPDFNEAYSRGGVRILYRAFCTTKESWLEKQPYTSSAGAVITWDGRLDNRAEIINQVGGRLTSESTDVAVVAAAYDKWGEKCFAKLIGDWALSIWNPQDRSLLFAKDPIGTHHLYYAVEPDHVVWCTIIDPLVLYAGHTFKICEEYIADWFSTRFPAQHLTPYVDVHAVPPSWSVLVRLTDSSLKPQVSRSQYWDFDPGKKIRYRTDSEYEEHMRSVFFTAVQRRLRADRPVLAELSGGMDSSSIVCIADLVIARCQAQCPRLDTISWYDDSDPNNDERPYFTKVEEKRGREGCHIDLAAPCHKEEVSQKRSIMSEFKHDRFTGVPFSDGRVYSQFFKQYATYATSQGHRVTLSGLGGESATAGGLPTPTPELQDLLIRLRIFALARKLSAWAIKMRRSRTSLLWEALRGFCPPIFLKAPEYVSPVPCWLDPGFVCRNKAALYPREPRVKILRAPPSFQYHLDLLDGERRLLANYYPSPKLLREVRYPYLDRDLLEFAYAVPREQLVGVGKRRYLMKRSLSGIVPEELLNRRKKIVVLEQTKQEKSTERISFPGIGPDIVSSYIGIVDATQFREAFQKARDTEKAFTDDLQRTLFLEAWLRHLTFHGVLASPASTKGSDSRGNSEPGVKSVAVPAGAEVRHMAL